MPPSPRSCTDLTSMSTEDRAKKIRTSAAQVAIASLVKAEARVCPSSATRSRQIGGTPDLSERGAEPGWAGCSGSCGDDSGEGTANCTWAHAGDDCYVGEEPDATSASHPAGCDVDLKGSALCPQPRHGSRRVIAHTFPLGGPVPLITLPGLVGSGDTRISAVPGWRPSSTATLCLASPSAILNQKSPRTSLATPSLCSGWSVSATCTC